MATMVKFQRQKKEIIDATYKRINDAETERALEFKKAVIVQAWFRGSRTRSYLRHLNSCALAIQRHWRGYQGRNKYQEVLKQRVFIMKLNFYNSKATKIQKVWRGYYVRKYLFNYYSRKRYLEGLQIKNEVVRQELANYAEQEHMMRQIKREEEDKKKLDAWAAKNHHLLSTTVIPGVYNSPYQPYPDDQEFHLKNAKPRVQPIVQRKTIFDPTCSHYDLPPHSPLPPIQQKPQGPFRDLREVQKQRYKTFQPSLRVSTDFYSLEKARQEMKQEEWVTRLNDETFQPFKTKTYQYEPLLHSTSKYGHLQYGSKYFREEKIDKFVTNENFSTLVPPIPIFDKLNDTYSQGQV